MGVHGIRQAPGDPHLRFLTASFCRLHILGNSRSLETPSLSWGWWAVWKTAAFGNYHLSLAWRSSGHLLNGKRSGGESGGHAFRQIWNSSFQAMGQMVKEFTKWPLSTWSKCSICTNGKLFLPFVQDIHGVWTNGKIILLTMSFVRLTAQIFIVKILFVNWGCADWHRLDLTNETSHSKAWTRQHEKNIFLGLWWHFFNFGN